MPAAKCFNLDLDSNQETLPPIVLGFQVGQIPMAQRHSSRGAADRPETTSALANVAADDGPQDEAMQQPLPLRFQRSSRCRDVLNQMLNNHILDRALTRHHTPLG